MTGIGAASEFKTQLLRLFYQDVHQLQQNNYDARRFSYDGVDRSQVFDVERHARNMDWFTRNYEAIFRTYARLVDQTSRDIFVDVLRFKLSGHLHVRLRNNIQMFAPQVKQFQEAFAGAPSQANVTGMFGNLVCYDGQWNGARYQVDTLEDALLYTLVYGQYFLARDGITIRPEPGDHVIDGGSCTGDTIAVFREAVGPSGHVYGFDPVRVHLDVCKMNTARMGYENTTVLPFGVSDRNVNAPLVEMTSYQPGYHPMPGDAPVPLRRIDDLVMDGTIERIDFLKLDVEGSEIDALRGAVSSLHRFRPKLALSIYHRPDDFFQICDFVHDLGLGYKFYLGHYTIHDEETVLYAVSG